MPLGCSLCYWFSSASCTSIAFQPIQQQPCYAMWAGKTIDSMILVLDSRFHITWTYMVLYNSNTGTVAISYVPSPISQKQAFCTSRRGNTIVDPSDDKQTVDQQWIWRCCSAAFKPRWSQSLTSAAPSEANWNLAWASARQGSINKSPRNDLGTKKTEPMNT